MKQKALHKKELKGAGYRGAPPSFYLTTKHPLGPYNQRKKVRPKMHNLTTVSAHFFVFYKTHLFRLNGVSTKHGMVTIRVQTVQTCFCTFKSSLDTGVQQVAKKPVSSRIRNRSQFLLGNMHAKPSRRILLFYTYSDPLI